MIPILFEPTWRNFNNIDMGGGKGRLTEAISCVITEELNGIYELEMQYPTNGRHFAELMQPALIAAYRPYMDGSSLVRAVEPFDIYKRTIENGVLTINAHHISYRFAKCYITNMYNWGTTLSGVLTRWLNTLRPLQNGQPWSVTADDTGVRTGSTDCNEIKSARDYLLDDTYSIRKFFNADFTFRCWSIFAQAHRGENRGVEIRYGKNATQLQVVKDETESMNALVAYWKGMLNSTEIIQLSDMIQPTPAITPVQALPIDFSAQFETAPGKPALNDAAARYLEENQPWLPKETANVQFIPNKDEKIDLGDTVSVFYSDGDLHGTMRVVRVTFDSLKEEYTDISLGELQKGYAVTSRNGLFATKQIMA